MVRSIFFYCSPYGSTGRADFWIFTGFSLMVSYTIFAVTTATKSGLPKVDIGDPNFDLMIAGAFVYLVIATTMAIRRLHDGDMTGLTLLTLLIPFVGPYVLLAICAFAPGTRGTNRFGPDPGAPHEDVKQVFESTELQPFDRRSAKRP